MSGTTMKRPKHHHPGMAIVGFYSLRGTGRPTMHCCLVGYIERPKTPECSHIYIPHQSWFLNIIYEVPALLEVVYLLL